jgi:hypothetical protein
MEFNKSHISKESIISRYRDGLESLVRYISMSDCLIIEDEFSERVVDIVLNDDGYIASDKIEKMIRG